MRLTPRLRWAVVVCGVLAAAALVSIAFYVVNVQERLDRLEAARSASIAQRDAQIEQLRTAACAFLDSVPQNDPRVQQLATSLHCTPTVAVPGAAVTSPPPLSLGDDTSTSGTTQQAAPTTAPVRASTTASPSAASPAASSPKTPAAAPTTTKTTPTPTPTPTPTASPTPLLPGVLCGVTKLPILTTCPS